MDRWTLLRVGFPVLVRCVLWKPNCLSACEVGALVLKAFDIHASSNICIRRFLLFFVHFGVLMGDRVLFGLECHCTMVEDYRRHGFYGDLWFY